MIDRIVALVAATSVCATAWGQIYSWTDEDGTMHYADRPPAVGEVRQIDPASTLMSTISGTELRGGEQALLDRFEERLREERQLRAQPGPAAPAVTVVTVPERAGRAVVYREPRLVPAWRPAWMVTATHSRTPVPGMRIRPPQEHRKLPWPGAWDARLPPDHRPLPWPTSRPAPGAGRDVRPSAQGTTRH